MLKRIDQDQVFPRQQPLHYRHHTTVDASIYPQLHSFYEIVLVTSGILQLKLCEKRLTLEAGSLALVRPGDIHSKSGSNVSHINLAFMAAEVDALFDYLCDHKALATLQQAAYISPVFLAGMQLKQLQTRLLQVDSIENSLPEKKTLLRHILYDVFVNHVLPNTATGIVDDGLPSWMSEALALWQMEEHRQEGLDFFCRISGYSKEHLCRLFKRHLGLTPNVYLNQQRLNYAVNLLLHSNLLILDVCFAAGFKSSSQFYKIFRDNYGVSPQKFRHMQTLWK
ncbi:AraC family transcriptional regulator [Ruminococcaceae bacterium OttesenSCG-928-A16]|nr:AraC family transcriptional regulator [Ruminococcaceae bacterium OttesenSCG-928-A16]